MTIENSSIFVRNLNIDKLYDYEEPNWCSTKVDITSTTPGSFDQTSVCGIAYDGVERIATFTPPAITSPTCDESGNFMNWWLDTDSVLTDAQSEHLKLTIDGPNNQIRIMPESTGTSGGTFTFTAYATLPDNTDLPFSFDLTVGCSNPTLTAPSTTAQNV